MDRVDFVVVGAGIAGASAAYYLAEHGTVTVLEAEATPGYHTTGRSAALFTESYESGPVRLLTMAGRGFLTEPPDGFTTTPILSPLPVLYIGREDQLPTLETIYEGSRGRVAIEMLTADEAAQHCPAVRVSNIAAGLFEPGAMEIDVHALHQGFLTSGRARGAKVVTRARVERLSSNGRGWKVMAGDVELEASVVVNASGAWCDHVASLAGIDPVGLQPYRRTAFTFPTGDWSIEGWPMVVDADEDFYFKPERTQFMGSLAEETPMEPHDVRPEEIDVALAVERINEATTLGIRHVSSTWAGLRTFAPDRLPVLGFDPTTPGFFWLGGQGGYGIMTSPGMGRTAAGLITSGRIPDDLAESGLNADAISPARLRT